jgi:hypothetical protein
MDIDATLAERGARYGSFVEHAEICQRIKEAMWAAPGWDRLAADQKQALETIADKIARALNGDPAYHDNWHDMVGYAKLVADRLQPVPAAPPDITPAVALATVEHQAIIDARP